MIRRFFLSLSPACAARRAALQERLRFVMRERAAERVAAAAEARFAELQQRNEQRARTATPAR